MAGMFPTISFGNLEIAPPRLALRSAKAAGVLAGIGIKDGETFAVMLRNEPALIEIMLGARQLGAYVVPLNWHFKADEAGFILCDSGAKVLIIHDDLLAQISAGIPNIPVFKVQGDATTAKPGQKSIHMSRRAMRDWHAEVAQADALSTTSDRPRGTVAYTSGITGRPKGVRRIPLADAAAATQRWVYMSNRALGITAGARCLISAPLYHSAPSSYLLFAAHCAAWLRVEARFDAEATLAAIERYKITHAYLVPIMFVRLLRLPQQVRNRYDLTSLQFVVTTGAPCPHDVKRTMIEWFGDVIYESYAASEIGYVTSIPPREACAKPGSAGRPIEGVSLAILDDQGEDVPPGTIGKIYVRTNLALPFTYINRPRDRDAIEHNGFVTVGDIGYVDADGYLFVIDRRTDLVLSGGVNIYPAEIEAQLTAIAGVADCAVFGVPDDEFGQSLVAVIQPTNGAVLTMRQVQEFLALRLANFKIPRVIQFRDTLPREDTGKIFKRRLLEDYLSGQ
jgi:long-chain acyl-CoA synthetase